MDTAVNKPLRLDALVAEIGSTTTLVSAFDGLAGAPRFVGQGMAPTTALAGDVTLGLKAAIADLKEALACPELVPLIEGGHTDAADPLLRAGVESSLRPLSGRGLSALVLGCTHYGIIGEAISAFLGEGVRLVSASDCAAGELRDYLVSAELQGGEGETRFLTSGSVSAFSRSASALLGMPVTAEQGPLMEVKDL